MYLDKFTWVIQRTERCYDEQTHLDKFTWVIQRTERCYDVTERRYDLSGSSLFKT